MPLLNVKPMDSPSPSLPGKGLLVWYFTLETSLVLCNMFPGVSPGDYKDFKPNNPDVRVEDGTLMINNIQKTNEGYYLCEAVNGIGSGLSAVVLISVQGSLFLCPKTVQEN